LYTIFSEDSGELSQFNITLSGQKVVDISLNGGVRLFSEKGPDYSGFEGIFVISDSKITGFGTISQTVPINESKGVYKYKGYLVNGRKEGLGDLTKKHHRYMGGFKQDLFHGEGTWVHLDTSEKKRGTWVSGKLHGQGTHIKDDGSQFEGRFEDGHFVEGTVVDSKGNKATGMFAKDGSGKDVTIIDKKSGRNYIGDVIYYTLKHG
jgi:hypothetical protein